MDVIAHMNRIKEVRVAVGMTRRELGDAAGVTQHTIRRYETGEIGLSVEMLGRLAQALGCNPADLVVSGLEEATSDVEPADAPAGMAALGHALGAKGLRLYRVTADVLADAGIRKGEQIVVDETPAAIEARRAGDVLLLRVGVPPLVLLRQYVPPRLVTTNRFGSDNSSLKLADRTVKIDILGVVVRPEDGSRG